MSVCFSALLATAPGACHQWLSALTTGGLIAAIHRHKRRRQEEHLRQTTYPLVAYDRELCLWSAAEIDGHTTYARSRAAIEDYLDRRSYDHSLFCGR